MCIRQVMGLLALAVGVILCWSVAPVWADDVDGDGVHDGLDSCNNTPPGTPVDDHGRPLGDIDQDCDTDLDDYTLFHQGMTGPPVPAEMVLVAGGEFEMGDTFGEGDPDELPVHTVYLSPYYIGKHDVKNAQYVAVLNWACAQGETQVHNGRVYHAGDPDYYFPFCDTDSADSDSCIIWDGTTFTVEPGRENQPMVEVTWCGAVAYCNWRSAMEDKPLGYDWFSWTCYFCADSYRLPTEAEWEKAARGGTPGHRFPWSDANTILHARCNYYSLSDYWYDMSPTSGYHPCWGVGSIPYTSALGFFTGALQYQADWGWPGSPTSYQTQSGVNGYGLYDMAGNVEEWCNDWYSESYYSSSPYENPHGPYAGYWRVRRGGGWGSNAYGCRCAYRAFGTEYYGDEVTGFRLVLQCP